MLFAPSDEVVSELPSFTLISNGFATGASFTGEILTVIETVFP